MESGPLMRWVWLLLAILVPGGLIVYTLGAWLLGYDVREVWRDAWRGK